MIFGMLKKPPVLGKASGPYPNMFCIQNVKSALEPTVPLSPIRFAVTWPIDQETESTTANILRLFPVSKSEQYGY